MKIKQLFFILALLGCAAGLYYWTKQATVRVLASQAVIDVTPFTLEQITYSYEKDPNGRVTEQRTIARRRDGSEAILGKLPGDAIMRRVDFMDGRTGGFVDTLLAKMTGFAREKELAARKLRLAAPPPNQCAGPGEHAVESEEVDSMATWRFDRKLPGNRTISTWRSIALHCYDVKMRLVGPDSKLLNSMKTVALSIGDPSDALFDMGSTYKEMPPSQLKRLTFEKAGVTQVNCPTCYDAAQDSGADANYYQQQTR